MSEFLKYQDYDKEEVRNIIQKAVQKRENWEPKFYAISGSHIYGFPSKESSDVDVRGFHIADGTRYMTLDSPQEQKIINQSENPTEGFEHVEDVELVSYELKKFGSLLHKSNFNVLEFLFHGKTVMNGDPMAIDALKDIIEDYLPADVPYHYRGMAKQNYHKYLDKDSNYRPEAKKFLYVIRGLLAAEYVQENASIEPDINVLAEHLLGYEDIETINDLIEVKRDDEFEHAPEELQEKAHDLISKLFNDLELEEDKKVEVTEYRQEINDWMIKVRDM